MADTVGGSGFPTANIQKGTLHYDTTDRALWEYINGPPILVSSWRLLNGIFVSDPDTSTWGLQQAGAMWFNSTTNIYKGWNGVQVVEVLSDGPLFAGSELTVFDDFMSGLTTSGNIGDYGWAFAGGTVQYIGGLTNHPGILRRTSAGIGVVCSLRLSNSVSSSFDLALPFVFSSVFRLSVGGVQETERIGLVGGGFSFDPPTDGIYFEKLTADTNWFCVTIAGGVQTRTSSGVAVATDASFHKFSIVRTALGAQFSIDNVNVGILQNTNIPIVICDMAVEIISADNAAEQIDIDYMYLKYTGMNR